MKKVKLVAATVIMIEVLAIACLGYYLSFQSAEASSAQTDWQLTVTGLVDQQLNLSLTQITAMPQTTEYSTLYCVDFPTFVVAQGNWTGVKLSYLLEQAGVSASAIKVAFHAADNYSTDLTVQRAMQDDVIVAYQKDGLFLSENLRLIVPGNWGYKWISKLTNIELLSTNYLGRWESSGYPDQGDIASNAPNSPAPSYELTLPRPPPINSTPLSSPTLDPTSSTSTTPTPMATQSSTSEPFKPSNTSISYSPSPCPSPSSSTLEQLTSSPEPANPPNVPTELIGLLAAAIVVVAMATVFALRKRRIRKSE
jgi:hypothetical protein